MGPVLKAPQFGEGEAGFLFTINNQQTEFFYGENNKVVAMAAKGEFC